MKAITVSSLRAKMKEYFDYVSENSDTIIVPRNGNDDDAIVIISIKQYNSWVETDYLNATEANRKALEESIRQDKENKIVKFEL